MREMNRRWHRIMAMLLVVAVCISVLPIQGFADVSALPAVVTVPLTNSIMGDEPYQEATFTYQIIAQSTDALGISNLPMPAGSTQDAQESEVNVYGGTTTQIPSIVFTKPGNYTYKVKQVRVSDEGYEGDGAEYTLIFHVAQAQRELGLEKEQTSDQTTLEATTEIQKFGNRVEGLVFNNRYTLPRFQVSFDSDGAKDAIGTQSVRYEMLAEQPDTPEKDGYVFGGWIDEASGPYNFLTPVTKDVHLKATWAKEMYFVEFREDVAADEPYKDEVLSAGRYSYGESVVAPPAPNHKLGYKFKGWNKDFSNVSSDMLIRATYEPIHYTIHYNANGGSGQMSDQDRTYERQEKLKSNEFSRGDDIFVGWAKSPDAQVPDYAENANAVNLTTNDGEVIQLYAVWKKVEPAKATLEVRKEIDGEVPAQKDIFHFTLMAMQTDAKNVTVMPTPEGTQRSYNFTITGDNKKTLNQIVFTEPGNYIYQLTEQDDGLPGYVADKSTYEIRYHVVQGERGLTQTNEIYKDGEKVDEIVFTDHYRCPRYQVNFDTTGADQTIVPQIVLRGNRVGVPDPTPTKTGYSFNGWLDAQGVPYDFTQPVESGMTLKAEWVQRQYHVEFHDAQDADGDHADEFLDEERIKAGETAVAPKAVPNNKLGYVFDHWDTNLSEIKDDTIIRAVYAPIKYKIIYAPGAEDVTGKMIDGTFSYDEDGVLSKNNYERAGYIFKGWGRIKGGNVDFEDGASVRNWTTVNQDEITLYAIWEKYQYAKMPLYTKADQRGVLGIETVKTAGKVALEDNQIIFTQPGEYIYNLFTLENGYYSRADAQFVYTVVADKEGNLSATVKIQSRDGRALDREQFFYQDIRQNAMPLKEDKEVITPTVNEDGTILPVALNPQVEAPSSKRPVQVNLKSVVFVGYVEQARKEAEDEE